VNESSSRPGPDSGRVRAEGGDPLSDVLRTVRLEAAFFYTTEACAPWSAEVAAAKDLTPSIMPGAEHLISYHILTAGQCWGGLQGEPPIELEAGDVIVFPHGDAYAMASAPGQRTSTLRMTAGRESVRLGTGPVTARFVCGFLGCDRRPFNPLIAALPHRLHLPGLARGWPETFAERLLEESRARRAGAESVLTRLAEIMFVDVLRRHAETLPPGEGGWLAGLRDGAVGRGLGLLHGAPAHPWTLDELAERAATSRSVFADRFTTLVGRPPMQYLAQWRMQLAANRLLTGTAKVATIAEEVGYESEPAFSRAFRRQMGASPAAWRRARLAAQGEAVAARG